MSSKVIITVVASLLLLCRDEIFAQSMPQSPIISKALQNGNLKLTVANGRINTNGSRPTSYSSRSSSSSGRRESFQLRSVNGRPQMAYELSTATDKLTLSISGDGKIHFKRVLTEKGKKETNPATEFEFLQSPGEPLRLTLGVTDEKQEVHTADSFWHLLLEHPEPLKEHVVPMLEMLRPGWKLLETADEVEQKLLKMAVGGQLPNHARWKALLVQLSDDSFARREAADRQLREGGESALRFLRELDFHALDAEQQFRVRRMIRSMSKKTTDDDLEEIASRLFGDSGVWLALLTRDQKSTREAAAARLSTMLGKSIDFDPAADQATRKEQVERLKKQLKPTARKPRPAS